MALVKEVTQSDVFSWLAKGWEDAKDMLMVSVLYSGLFLLIGVFISFGFYHLGLPYLVLPALSGFLLVGPAIAVGFYEGSRRKQAGERFELHHAIMGFAVTHMPLWAWGLRKSSSSWSGSVFHLRFLHCLSGDYAGMDDYHGACADH